MLKVGIIGCGAISQRRHLPEYNNRADVEIVAVCDMNVERAAQVASQYGIRYSFRTHEELLDLPEIDAVSVCTPNHLHAGVAIEALKRGKHVLCEKPMATTIDEAKAMIDVAESMKRYLMIGHNQRFIAVHRKAKELLSQGAIGKVLSFVTTFGHSGPESWSVDGNASWFFQQGQAFAGALGDLGIHKADLVMWLLDDNVELVQAMAGTLHKQTNVEDHASMLLRMGKGAMGVITSSWTYYPRENNTTILYGDKGTMKIGNHPVFGIVVEKTDGTSEYYKSEEIPSNQVGQQPNSGIIDHFVEGILSGTGHVITGYDGLKALEVVLAGLQSARDCKGQFLS